MGLAISLELPLLIVDVQRGGPSTGLPTKTEQADLHARDVRPPRRGAAADRRRPVASHCFDAAFEAVRIAVKYRTPVILLTDGYLANGAEPWLLPDVDALPDISVPFATETNHGDEFWPYLRDPETLARPWAIPGTPGLVHRIGGIEKEDGTGNISYDPENHEHMVPSCAPTKVAGIANDIPLDRSRRRRRRRGARARLGEHLGCDHGGGAPGPAAGPQGRARAPHAPQPVPRRPRRGAAPATEGARARDEPRAALAAGAGRVPRRRADVHQGARRPFRAAEMEAKILEMYA